MGHQTRKSSQTLNTAEQRERQLLLSSALLLLTTELELDSPFFPVTPSPAFCCLASFLSKQNLQVLERWHKIIVERKLVKYNKTLVVLSRAKSEKGQKDLCNWTC